MKEHARILILDDEEIVCDRLATSLRKRGFEVEWYVDSTEAVARLSSARFDILVTDLKMPRISGLDVLSHAHREQPGIKSIVITGFATAETAQRARLMGAAEFIPKPFKIRRLRELIMKIARDLSEDGPPEEG